MSKNGEYVAFTIPFRTLPNYSFALEPFPMPTDLWTPIYRLVSDGNDDDAGDLLLKTIDDMCRASEWGHLDRFILAINIDRLNLNLMYVLLVATRPAREHLLYYDDLFQRVLSRFTKVDAAKTLEGLRP